MSGSTRFYHDGMKKWKRLKWPIFVLAFACISISAYSTPYASGENNRGKSASAHTSIRSAGNSASFDCTSVTEIPQTECTALVTFYESTDGVNWKSNTAWLTTSTPCTWHGILCSSGHVTRVSLGQNSLLGPIPPEIANLTNLTQIYLNRNLLNGSIPRALASIPTLQDINIGDNNFSGTIPAEFGSLPRLTSLYLYGNKLSGEIPAELGNLSRLNVLGLYGNNLTGNIPVELKNLTSLEHLLLYGNKLGGQLPPELGDLENLRSLRLDSNLLTGSIPGELVQLINLENFRLQNNRLDGPFPDIWANMVALTNLEVRNNNLSGNLPESLCNLIVLNRLVIGNNALSGPLPLCLQDNIILNELRFDQTDVCIPDDDDFRAWLDRIWTVVGSTPCTPVIATPPIDTPTRTDTPTATETPTPTPTATATPAAYTLVLIYAVLDNNLSAEWDRLINSIEAGIHENIRVRLLIDGGDNVKKIAPNELDSNAYVYDLVKDTSGLCPNQLDPKCGDQYVRGENFDIVHEDTAYLVSLSNFIKDGIQEYPDAAQVHLALVGHGSGWSADARPGTPAGWVDQNGNEVLDELGGMLWDDNPGVPGHTLHAMSTAALGEALREATESTGHKIDLLYLDGCSMGMAEVAYEVHNSANYLLASPNTDWASFGYKDLLATTNSSHNGKELGKKWLQTIANELRSNRGHPFTIALTDLSQMEPLAGHVSRLADVLIENMPTYRVQITAAFSATEIFDSNYDFVLDLQDSHADLLSFTNALQSEFTENEAVTQEISDLQHALPETVIAEDHESGPVWLKPHSMWEWGTLGGLSIYLPLGDSSSAVAAAKRLLYNQTNLTWARDTTWDEFIDAYYNEQDAQAALFETQELPTCTSTSECEGLQKQLLIQSINFLPIVIKE